MCETERRVASTGLGCVKSPSLVMTQQGSSPTYPSEVASATKVLSLWTVFNKPRQSLPAPSKNMPQSTITRWLTTAKEAQERIKRDQLGANIFDKANEAEVERELDEDQREQEERKKLGKKVKVALRKREKHFEYESDSEHPYSYSVWSGCICI